MGLRDKPQWTLRKNPQTGHWEVALIVAAKMIKKDATAILEEVKAKGQVAQDYLNLLLEGVDGRRYHIESD
jgi:hypothetical protein